MNIKLSVKVFEQLKRVKQKDKKLAAKVEKQLLIFGQNPKHPSLRLHKLSGYPDQRWSISITTSIRMIYVLIKEDTAYFIAIGTHDQVYEK